ncbi:MAG: hypothetical protein RL660_3166 [Bacteroidota bacterium]|jgi:DNA-3-methyladenine glycosylase II
MAIDFSYLAKHKKLHAFIQAQGPVELAPRKNVFLQLVRAIAGQQLSTKAAASIYDKFLQNCGSKNPQPQDILALNIEDMRAVGFSYNKAQYIHNIASFWQEHKLTDAKLFKMQDRELIDFLTQIKGVGTWTVEMLLMFTMARPNIFAVGDLGIQQGMCMLYGWKDISDKALHAKMLAKAKEYEPYSTYVCLYIWQYKDLSKQKIAKA